jgi:hypothetical protein
VPAGTELTLSTDWPDAVVRFTTDGSEPNERSPAVTGPITIDRTVTLKARAFAPDRRSVRSITLRYSCPEGAAPARKGAAVEGR